MNKKRTLIFGTLALLLTCGVSVAQIEVDQTRPAPPGAEIYIENMFGSVEVVAWDEPRIRVSGRLAAGAEDLDFGSDDDEGEFDIEVEVPEHWFYESDDDTDYRSEIVVRVPRDSSVGVETLNASVKIDGIGGAVEVETVNGSVMVAGDPEAVEIESMTGNIEVRARSAEMEVESVSGTVTLLGATGSVSVESVSGVVSIVGQALEEVSVETVSGDVVFDGDFAAEGDFEVESHSGNVEMSLPGAVRARFEFRTFSGSIHNDIGPAPRKTGRFEPHTELRFSSGVDGFDVAVETFSGDITLRTH